MIIAQIFAIWLGVVFITVAIDMTTSYLAERHAAELKKAGLDKKEVKKGFVARRNLKKIEIGLKNKRQVNVATPHGAHRRLQAS